MVCFTPQIHIKMGKKIIIITLGAGFHFSVPLLTVLKNLENSAITVVWRKIIRCTYVWKFFLHSIGLARGITLLIILYFFSDFRMLCSFLFVDNMYTQQRAFWLKKFHWIGARMWFFTQEKKIKGTILNTYRYVHICTLSHDLCLMHLCLL